MPETACFLGLVNSALRESAEQVLATMFFAVVVGDAPVEVATAAPLVRVRVSFSGPLAGTFYAAISESEASVLATDFYGQDTVQPEAVYPAICELANMVCGSTLSRIEPESLFSLSPPEPADKTFAPDGVVLCFELPDGWLTFSIQAD